MIVSQQTQMVKKTQHCPGQLAVQGGTRQAGLHRLKEIRQASGMLCPVLIQLQDRMLRKLKGELWALNARLRGVALLARASGEGCKCLEDAGEVSPGCPA